MINREIVTVRGSVVLEAGFCTFIAGWRNYAYFQNGKRCGVSLMQPLGAAAVFARMGCKFYAAGTWEAGEAVPGELPPIKPEVLDVINGKAIA